MKNESTLPQAVIFDMDGVLVNSEKFYFERRMRYFDRHQVTPRSRNIQDYLGKSAAAGWEIALPYPAERAKIRAQFDNYRRTHRIPYADYLIDGVPQALQQLQDWHIQTALASAGSPDEIQRMLVACGLTDYFSVVISGDTMTRNKPDPQIYHETVARLQLDPANCLVIEDSIPGITAAKRAGLTTWALRPKDYVIDQSQADWRFGDYGEFVGRLEELV
ncbi:HAD family hydrolase [Schleiferilactobacillus perolens]|uniref:HAD-superfamily hydrolase n=1 Tax=Schleiferilactobacillus perolens DSM 12744 TaxID=1423792 RepID=A0A0R1MN76_9LACO|nr:HAD family phosphatase [Schleiferilactobacillus perolens]KRL08793.1 HAD-superfamily hydrolase [Schleiferilactobacillus perolens DSM 12744]